MKKRRDNCKQSELPLTEDVRLELYQQYISPSDLLTASLPIMIFKGISTIACAIEGRPSALSV